MAEESQKAAMNAAIRAQRERQNVPRSLTGDGPPPVPVAPAPRPQPVPVPAAEPAAEPRRGLLSRLFGK